MARKIDHIVYAVPDLDKAITAFEEKTGVAPVFGGYHLTQGTKNALVNLGDQCYLELLAVDLKNTKIPAPRWMGVDQIDTPQITRWSLKSDHLKRDSQIVAAHRAAMGVIEEGSRQMTNGSVLTWGIIMPLTTPKVELIPFMTDWSQSTSHPTDTLPQQCQFKSIELVHPDPAPIQQVFDLLGLYVKVEIGSEASISILIEGPRGMVEI